MNYFEYLHQQKKSAEAEGHPAAEVYGDLIVQANDWIETAAYYLWIQEGCPEGRDREHWDQAVQMYVTRIDH
jgi:hypothetical protein